MTATINYTIHRIIFAIAIAIFFLLKLESCYLPYYWDELGVYSQAVLYMYDHTPSLLPGDLPDVFSRGHPLLFVFIYSCYFKVFGTSVLGAHIFACFISISFMAISYRIAELFLFPTIALLSTLLLMVQPVFFAQSVFVLPEIMLGLFALLSLYYYLNKNIWVSSIFAALAILTKETGIILPIVYMVMEGILFFRREIGLKKLALRVFILFIPYYVFGMFIVVQRIQNGWFFYPYHTGFISLNPESIYWRLISYLNFIFTKQGRLTWLVLLISFIIIVPFVYKINPIKQLTNAWNNFTEKTFVYTTFGLFILGTLGYSALNYFMQRYIILIYPIFTMLVVSLIFYLAKKRVLITCLITLLFGVINLFFMKNAQRILEDDMSYADFLKVQKEISNYFDNAELKSKKLGVSFPVLPGFFDPRLGYVTQAGFNLQVTPNTFNADLDYYVYTYPGNLDDSKIIKNDSLKLVKKFHEGVAEGYIYKTEK